MTYIYKTTTIIKIQLKVELKIHYFVALWHGYSESWIPVINENILQYTLLFNLSLTFMSIGNFFHNCTYFQEFHKFYES